MVSRIFALVCAINSLCLHLIVMEITAGIIVQIRDDPGTGMTVVVLNKDSYAYTRVRGHIGNISKDPDTRCAHSKGLTSPRALDLLPNFLNFGRTGSVGAVKVLQCSSELFVSNPAKNVCKQNFSLTVCDCLNTPPHAAWVGFAVKRRKHVVCICSLVALEPHLRLVLATRRSSSFECY